MKAALRRRARVAASRHIRPGSMTRARMAPTARDFTEQRISLMPVISPVRHCQPPSQLACAPRHERKHPVAVLLQRPPWIQPKVANRRSRLDPPPERLDDRRPAAKPRAFLTVLTATSAAGSIGTQPQARRPDDAQFKRLHGHASASAYPGWGIKSRRLPFTRNPAW